MISKRRLARRWGLLVLSASLSGCSLPPFFAGNAPVYPAGRDHFAQQHLNNGVPPGQDQMAPVPPPRPFPPNEQISQMSQRVASMEDERRAFAGRMQMLELQLTSKDKALAVAVREIQESTTQLVNLRSDLQQWQQDMKSLREKCGTMEKENREALEAMIKTLERCLEREKEQVKTPDPLQFESLPLPKQQK